MQEKSQLPNVPPLSGPALVAGINEIARTLGTNFAGADDPAALAWPYATWADTANGLLKRRNATGTAWVVEAELFERAAKRNGDSSQDFSAKNLLVGDGSAGAVAVIRNGVTEAIRIKDTGEVVIPNLPAKLDTANAFGVGQSWQVLTSSRAIGVVYTNSTGRPIEVKYTVIGSSGFTSTITVDSTLIPGSLTQVSPWDSRGSAIVPPGSTYVVNGGIAVNAWVELR